MQVQATSDLTPANLRDLLFMFEFLLFGVCVKAAAMRVMHKPKSTNYREVGKQETFRSRRMIRMGL